MGVPENISPDNVPVDTAAETSGGWGGFHEWCSPWKVPQWVSCYGECLLGVILKRLGRLEEEDCEKCGSLALQHNQKEHPATSERQHGTQAFVHWQNAMWSRKNDVIKATMNCLTKNHQNCTLQGILKWICEIWRGKLQTLWGLVWSICRGHSSRMADGQTWVSRAFCTLCNVNLVPCTEHTTCVFQSSLDDKEVGTEEVWCQKSLKFILINWFWKMGIVNHWCLIAPKKCGGVRWGRDDRKVLKCVLQQVPQQVPKNEDHWSSPWCFFFLEVLPRPSSGRDGNCHGEKWSSASQESSPWRGRSQWVHRAAWTFLVLITLEASNELSPLFSVTVFVAQGT